MRMIHQSIAVIAAAAMLAIAGCAGVAPTISGDAAPGVKITEPTIVKDLQSASWNMDQAVAVGALAANDPAPACLHDVLVKAGIEVPAGSTPARSFEAKNDGVASAGAIVYILAQKAKALQAAGGIQVDVSCEALVGRVVVDGAKTVNRAALGLAPGLLIK